MKNKINTIVTHYRNPSEDIGFICNQDSQMIAGFNEFVVIPSVPAVNPALLFQRLALNIQLLDCVNSREEYEYLQQEVVTLCCVCLCPQLNFSTTQDVI